MNKVELIRAIAEETGLTKKDATTAVEAYNTVVTDVLKKKGKVSLVGFGTFETTTRASHKGRHPKTGETITIAAFVSPKFRPGKSLKEAVSGKT